MCGLTLILPNASQTLFDIRTPQVTRAIPPTGVLNTSSHRLFLTRMSTDDGAAGAEKWGVGILETSLMRSWMMTFCGRGFVRGVLGQCQVNFSQVSHHIRGPPQHRHARNVVLHPVLEVARVRGLRASGVTFATIEGIFQITFSPAKTSQCTAGTHPCARCTRMSPGRDPKRYSGCRPSPARL